MGCRPFTGRRRASLSSSPLAARATTAELGNFARARPKPDLLCARNVTDVGRDDDDDDDDDDDANLVSFVATAGLHARVDGKASMSRERERLAVTVSRQRRRETRFEI